MQPLSTTASDKGYYYWQVTSLTPSPLILYYRWHMGCFSLRELSSISWVLDPSLTGSPPLPYICSLLSVRAVHTSSHNRVMVMSAGTSISPTMVRESSANGFSQNVKWFTLAQWMTSISHWSALETHAMRCTREMHVCCKYVRKESLVLLHYR